MPPIQTTYNSEYTPAVAGMVADLGTRNVISRSVQDATLAFGVAVFQGATDNTVTATPGTAFVGISLIDKNVVPTTTEDYNQYDTAGVLTLGVVWVLASSATVQGQPVYLTAGGLFTDVVTGDTLVPGATFDNSVVSGSLVRVRLS
jgi:hypothetical protein